MNVTLVPVNVDPGTGVAIVAAADVGLSAVYVYCVVQPLPVELRVQRHVSPCCRWSADPFTVTVVFRPWFCE